MGNQANGGKGKSPPNPNYGSGASTDNSNGVYNAGVASAAAAPQYDQGLGAGTLGATPGNSTTGTAPLSTTPTGATGLVDPNAPTGATGAVATPIGATGATPPAAYTGPQPGGKGQGGKGNMAPTPAGTMQSQAALAGATGSTAPAGYSTSYVPPPPPVFTAAAGTGSPMSGSSLTVGDAVSQGKAAKGGTPGAPAGTLGGFNNPAGGGQQQGAQSGVAGATGTTAPGATGTTGPVDYAAQLPNRFNAQTDPTGGYAKMYNQQQAAKAAQANAPDWMKKMMAGTGGAEIAEGTNKDWQSVVKKMSGSSDPFAAMQQLAKTAGPNGMANVHRSLKAAGIATGTADRLLEMFTNSGSNQEQAARRLGVYEQWAKMTQGDKWQDAVGKEKELEAWRRANPTLGNSPAYPVPGATGTTAPPPAATGATGPPPTVTPDVTQPPPGTGGVVTPAESAATPGLTTDRVNQIARQYMVSPEIAKQIYMQILQQSQGSGGGDGPGGSGGVGGNE